MIREQDGGGCGRGLASYPEGIELPRVLPAPADSRDLQFGALCAVSGYTRLLTAMARTSSVRGAKTFLFYGSDLIDDGQRHCRRPSMSRAQSFHVAGASAADISFPQVGNSRIGNGGVVRRV